MTSFPDIQEARRGSLHGVTVSRLRQMIVSGDMPPGKPLREKELCVEFGISRSPLREAIRTLAREGLVKLYPNRSAVVAPLEARAVEDLYQVIGHVEALGGRLACERATDKEVRAISILYHEMLISYHQRDLSSYILQNRNIHYAQLLLSRNHVLVETWEMLHPRVEQARTLANLYPDRWHAAVLEHEAMLKALAARDGAELSRLAAAHYENGLIALESAGATVRG